MPSVSAVLTATIALIGVYIAFALIVSWFQEQIAGIVSLRSKTLILGIRQLIGDEEQGHAFAKQLISTVGEPFTVPRRTPDGQTQPDQTLAKTASTGNPVADGLGISYLSKFINAKVPTEGTVRFPSYVASRDFAANLLTYVNDNHAVARARTLVAAFAQLSPATAATLPAAVQTAFNGLTIAQVTLQQVAGDEVSDAPAKAAAEDAVAKAGTNLVDAVRKNADGVVGLQTAVPAVLRDQLGALAAAATSPDAPARAAVVLATLKAVNPAILANLPAAIAAARDAQQLLAAVQTSGAALAGLPTAIPESMRADLRSLLATGNIDAAGAQSFATLEAAANAMPKPLSDILSARLRDAEGDYQTFVASVEQWYDDYMARVSGWYKRCATLMTLYLSIIIVVALNIDSISIARSLAANSALAQSLSAFATNELSAYDQNVRRAASQTPPPAGATPAPNPPAIAIATRIVCPPQGASTTATPAPVAGVPAPLCATCPNGFLPVDKDACTLDTAPLRALPLGYPDPLYARTAQSVDWFCTRGQPCDHAAGYTVAGLLKLLGWALTVIALCLGAPFWFDLLRTIVNVRASGAPPQLSADVRKNSSPSPS